MTERPAPRANDASWTPSRRVRVAVGLFSGVGATGITAGLGLIGSLIEVDVPVIDPSPLILLAPLVVVPAFAGAVLREGAAVVAITAGAVGAPIVALLTVDWECTSTLFAGIALVSFAIYAFFFAGLAAYTGERNGSSDWFVRNRIRGVRALVVLGAIGVVGWIAAVVILFRCP